MSNLVEVSHPLIKHHLSRLRDKQTPPTEFRQLVQRLAVLLAYEATSDLELSFIEIETPLTRMTGQGLSQRVGLVPILRAGLGMVDPILNLIPTAEVWHLGLYRDEQTSRPVEYYSKLPHSEPVDVALVVVQIRHAAHGRRAFQGLGPSRSMKTANNVPFVHYKSRVMPRVSRKGAEAQGM